MTERIAQDHPVKMPKSLIGDEMAEMIWRDNFDFMKFYAYCEAHEPTAPWGLKARAFGFDRDLADKMDELIYQMRFVDMQNLLDFGCDLGTLLSLQSRHSIGACYVEDGQKYPEPILTEEPNSIAVPVIEDEELIDIMTFSLSNLSKCQTLSGNGWALGTDILKGYAFSHYNRNIKVFASPLSWLAARSKDELREVSSLGLFIFDYNAKAASALSSLGRDYQLVPENLSVQTKLVEMFNRYRPLPKISLNEGHDQ